MDLTELGKRLKDYGADMHGVDNRFSGDMALYQSCILMFFQEPNIDLLQKEIAAKNYYGAFLAAHALKGLSGNLGLTPLYGTLCALTETLRTRDYGSVGARYDATADELRRLEKII